MSDLFTTLAREAVGAPMTVAPRGRSRFEAPSLPLNLASETEEAVAAPADTPPPRAASPRPEVGAEPQESAVAQPASHTSRSFSHERIHRAEVESEIVSRIEFRGEPTRAGREPASEMSEPVRAASARAARERVRPVYEAAKAASAFPTPAVATEPAHFAATHEDVAGHAVAAEVMPPDAPVALRRQAPPQVETIAPQRQAPPQVETIAPQRHAPPQVETILPRIVVPEAVKPDAVARAQGEPARAQPSPALRRQAAPPPAIHVTIGRVEVRAVTPPAAKPAPVAPKPVKPAMSLADYLEQRNRSG